MVINRTTNGGPFDGASPLLPGIISLSESLAREVVIDSYFSPIRLPSGQFTRGHILTSLGIELGTASLVVLLITTMPLTRVSGIAVINKATNDAFPSSIPGEVQI